MNLYGGMWIEFKLTLSHSLYPMIFSKVFLYVKYNLNYGTIPSGNQGQVEVTWQTLLTIAHSIMVHAQFSDEYLIFSLMHTTDHIFPVLTIKHLVNQDSGPTTPHKLESVTKNSLSNLRVLFYPCILTK